MLGPVFYREAATSPRRPPLYIYRTVYVVALIVLMCTAWLILTGTQIIRDVGDMARFGAVLFQILAPLQLALIIFLSALVAASNVSQEKDRRTLILLLMTRLSNSELVVGKLMASLLNVLVMLVAGLPVFLAVTLFGGVSYGQVARVFLATLATALASGSLGCLLAFWREKTFQTLALTALTLLCWLAVGEAVRVAAAEDATIAGVSPVVLAAMISPYRGLENALSPVASMPGFYGYLLFAFGVAAVLNTVAVLRVRIWNPSREVRPGQHQDEAAAEQAARQAFDEISAMQQGHIDSHVDTSHSKSRTVWDNPILWREVCTWAYGRKVLVIRAVYLLLFAATAYALHQGLAPVAAEGLASRLASSGLVAPFCVLSLVIINALAVTSVTNERDGQALDLLLATDLSPKEFVYGKMFGVLWVTKEMVLLPLALFGYLFWRGDLGAEPLVFLAIGLLVLDVFVAMLGIHCGMGYANSRNAIGVSLGTVFFLFLGVVTCMLMMISFSGSFKSQLAPFLAFILGGWAGLFVSLGVRNQSSAIGWASLLLPFATFQAITSFLLGESLSVFLIIVGVYGFTIAAMLMPAIGEFDIAMGRTQQGGDA
ncbi:MAG: ABC transporter permease [Planctomycetales bacterium]|nr:ABC transporter permease [Planctomycetales bacterium]